MKFEPVIRLLTTFGVLIFSSCGEKDSPDEEASFEEQIEALESFKKRWVSLEINTLIEAFDAYDSEKDSLNNEEQDFIRDLRSLTQKLERLDTENLPYDLETATERFRSDLIKFYEQMKKMPIPIELFGNNEAIAAWGAEQREKNPKFDQEFDKGVETWEEELEKLEKNIFDEDEVGAVFAKYSININFSGLTGEQFKPASAPESSPASVVVGVQPQIEQSVSDNAPPVSGKEPLPKHDPAAKDEGDPTGIDKREEEGMALKLQVAELKGQLAEVEITIKNEQARWKSGLAVINKLTNYKKTPVKEGSWAYRQCLEASNMMKKIEAGAPKLNAQKSKLEAMIKSLEDK